MDTRIFGPLLIRPRYTIMGSDAYNCAECKAVLKKGDRYGWLTDEAVCDPCADRLEACTPS